MKIRVFELEDGRFREAGLMMEDGRYSGRPWLEPVLKRLVERHGMEEAARRVGSMLVQARLEP